MTAYSLLICIVPHDYGEFIAEAAASAGAPGGTVVMGRGTASNSILRVLGLGDTSKDIACIVVPSAVKRDIIDAVVAAGAEKKPHFGILFSTDVSNVIKTGSITGGDDAVTAAKKHRMITIIVKRGYADDVMAAARKAGAGGGTIINARGTAKEGDRKFFGMEIVPEKEMLVILAGAEKADAIIEAVRALPCLADPGSGIAFCSEADDFTMLGRKEN
jgi:nitrogen regulatory protein PII